MVTLATQLADWVSGLRFEDLPPDVVEATKLRLLDVLGLALAGAGTRLGRSIRAGAIAVSLGVKELLRGKPFVFEDLGPAKLKGIPEAVPVYAVQWRT